MNIAILGAGVAGLSSAIALRLAGCKVCVYERQETPSTLGAGIVLWPNACYVLKQLGVLSPVEAVAGRPARMHRRASDGTDLGSIDIRQIDAAMGYPSLSVLREDLQHILTERLRMLGVEVRHGYSVTDIAGGDSGRAGVGFSNGERADADIIIGADGRMNSLARRYVCGDNAPVYQGFINWVGVYESAVDTFDEIAVSDFWGVGERFGIVPISARKAYWAGGVASTEIGTRDPTAYRRELHQLFAHWPAPVPQIIRDSAEHRINKIYVHDHDPVRVWHRDNLLMIGDAAHAPLPTSGQGACQALEDAWHLARLLAPNPGDYQRVFSEFASLRFDKTAGIIQAARGLAASLFNRDADFCRVRNENSRRTDYSQVALAMSRGWGQQLPLGG